MYNQRGVPGGDGHSDAHVGTPITLSQSFFQKTIDDPTAAFTLWLAVATTGLWLFTARLWKATRNLALDTKAESLDQLAKMQESIKEAARSANAMQEANAIARDALVAQNRPYLFVEFKDELEGREMRLSMKQWRLEGRLHITNVGGGPAIIRSVEAELYHPYRNGVGLSVEPKSTIAFVLREGETNSDHHLWIAMGGAIDPGKSIEFQSGEHLLILRGLITFDQFGGPRRALRFTRVMHPTHLVHFHDWGGPEDNCEIEILRTPISNEVPDHAQS